jgi:hypothetical protein
MSSLSTRFALAALLFAATALTGCNASPSVAGMDNFPSFLGASHFNGEPISTLGANYSRPQDTHHSTRLHELPGRSYARTAGHRSL